MKGSSLNISRATFNKTKYQVDHDFFNQIVNLAKKKKKILDRSGKKSINTEMKIERVLFRR